MNLPVHPLLNPCSENCAQSIQTLRTNQTISNTRRMVPRMPPPINIQLSICACRLSLTHGERRPICAIPHYGRWAAAAPRGLLCFIHSICGCVRPAQPALRGLCQSCSDGMWLRSSRHTIRCSLVLSTAAEQTEHTLNCRVSGRDRIWSIARGRLVLGRD
jgi:hypothetical protein